MLFQELNLQSWIIKAINEIGFKKLTNIQEKTIIPQLKNKNIIGVSYTGSGKTLSFLIPILNKIELNENLQSLIIVPTRELARQVNSCFHPFKKQQSKLKVQLLIGGNDYQKQIDNINRTKPQILITTISRLKDAIIKKAINTNNIKHIVLDEADMLMDLGFFKDIDLIFNHLNNIEGIQKTAWSATLHEMLANQLSKYYKNTNIIKIGSSIYQNNKIIHNVIHNKDKQHSLAILLKKINPYFCLIFANKKNEVQSIFNFLKKNNFNVSCLHADLSSRERKNAYKNAKNLKYQFLVASDLASRGLDIDGVSHVISWNMPNDNEWYIHRAGRTGRGKYNGESWILSSDNKDDNKLLFFESKGIVFTHYFIKNNLLEKKKYFYFKKKDNLDLESEHEIKKLIINKPQKIKPCYKKKQKEAIEKIKQKSKRRYLDKKIKQELIKNYKLKNSKKSSI